MMEFSFKKKEGFINYDEEENYHRKYKKRSKFDW